MHSSDIHPHHGDGSFSFQHLRINPQGEISHREQGSAVYRRLDLGQGLSLDLVWVPGGTFTMGSPALEPPLGEDAKYYRDLFNAERPQHRVTVADFWLGKYLVTQAQYGAVMGQNPSQFKGDNRPVEQVSWDEAIASPISPDKPAPFPVRPSGNMPVGPAPPPPFTWVRRLPPM